MRCLALTWSVVLIVLLGAAVPAHAEGRKWAVLVGIDRYQRPDITPLNFAVADVRELAATLKSHLGFLADDVFVMTSDQSGDDAPTRTNVAYRLDWLREHVKVGDTVLFFFSGHGMELDDTQSYLLTVEADARSASTLQDSSLDTRNLQKRLQALQASQLLIFVDACRSDPRGGSRANADNPLRGGLSRDLTLRPASQGGGNAQVVATFFACSPGQRSYEWADRGHGFFTWYLIEGLKGGAASGGRITLPGLIGYLETEVSRSVERATGNKQVPFMEAKGSALASWVLAQDLKPVVSSTSGTSVTGQLAEARQLLKQHKGSQAEIAFTRILLIDDKNASALAGRARARLQTFSVDAARVDAIRAVELDPRNVDAHLARAACFLSRHDYRQALADFDMAIALDPRCAEAHTGKGYCRGRVGALADALPELEKALALDPQSALTYAYRGYFRFQLDKRQLTPRVQQDLEMAIRLDPRLNMAYSARAVIYQTLGKWGEALADLDQYVALVPLDPNGYAARGLCHLNLSKLAEAIRDADAAINIDRNIELAWTVKGSALMRLGDKNGALAAWRESVRLNPAVRDTLPAEIKSQL